ncbi:MAG: hypothetical protein IM606_04375 [Cytophagales bacterium]|jgi:hypothetical protein|nr:hypothetical protein [Cytophagales bacterium]MCA6387854.1 hypothetical protein [Cytophagales bacterium]MCA6391416.1 hypothetical protein [Cytophagales bacterium]MCA6394407.1 hypothetical protein [Cytophagales bacterium]MCA6398401.1 hypothetical protein [Cytophagales bacterium]
MDFKKLDLAVQAIALRRNELKKLDYNNPKYDDLEEELHDLEDSLLDEFGNYLEGVFQEIHDKYCPDTDVLLPIAYMAKTYTITQTNEFSVGQSEGVYVEVDSLPGKETKLVMIPNPLRVVLNIGQEQQRLVWGSK